MTENFTAETFSPHVDSTFKIADGPELKLETVNELGEAHEEAKRAPFSIIFRGPPEPLLPQQIYSFEHKEIGSFDAFIVPVGVGVYEAVFT
jgi:hypothetical protein